jgi:hypothetical protein
MMVKRFPSLPRRVMEENWPMGSENLASILPEVLPVTPMRVPPGLQTLWKEIWLLES